MASVELKNLSVLFDDVRAVDDLSLNVADGEFVVLLGPSGCGKTTTLRCIAGLEAPSSGHILFDGVPVERLTPQKREVAMVFQFVSLYPHLSVRENIAFPLRARGERAAKVRDKIGWVARTFDLEGILDRRPGQLPPGAWQKASLARAMVREPRVLLLDEPLSAIDEQFREEMRWELRHVQKELGTTTIHVTHDQREAMSLADRVVLMRDGRIVQAGPPAELYNEPVDSFAAVFIGSPSINLIDGQTDDTGVRVNGQRLRLPEMRGNQFAGVRGAVRLGIRPHHVRPAMSGEDVGVLELDITGTYATGHERYFEGFIGDTPIRGMLPKEADVSGRARIHFDPRHLMLFRSDGERIRL